MAGKGSANDIYKADPYTGGRPSFGQFAGMMGWEAPEGSASPINLRGRFNATNDARMNFYNYMMGSRAAESAPFQPTPYQPPQRYTSGVQQGYVPPYMGMSQRTPYMGMSPRPVYGSGYGKGIGR